MDDLISRQAVIEINRSYHGQMPNEVNHRIWKEINELPSAQPKPCEDTISRQAAINAIENTDCELPPYAWNELMDAIMKVPSAQPERRPMLYRDRVMLAKNFEEWARENHVIDCPEAIIYYLDIIGLIQPKRKADALDEIVRCKECKHGSPNGKYGCRVYHYRRYETHDMKPDDYCSRAERRTDDSD